MPAAPPGGGAAANPVFGMVVIVIAMSIIPLADGLAKLLTARLPTMELVWARYLFHFACLFPLVLWRYGRRTFTVKKPGFQILRGCLLLVATMCFYRAVADIPLVDAVAIVFVYPFVVTALSPLVLGEKVGIWRWSAVIVGFIGALIVIRPGFQTFSPAMLLALGTGVSYAVYVLMTRKMAGTDPPLVTVMITGLVGTVLSTLILPFVWVMPSSGDLLILMLVGVLAAIGHYGVIVAHEYASAPQLAPYSYVEIVSGTVVGYVLFSDLPQPLTWLGIAVIVTSGILIAWREEYVARRERRLARPVATV